MSQRVLLLSGYKGSGKDLCGDYLVSHYDFRRLAFADLLKDHVSEKYGIPREHLDDRRKKEAALSRFPVLGTDAFTREIHRLLRDDLYTHHVGQGVSETYWTPRALCILEGSIARAVDPEYWTRRVYRIIAANPGQDYVVTDLRYRSEIESAKAILPHCRTVRVSRAGVEPTTADPSERDLEGYQHDQVLRNNGTKRELYEKITTILQLCYGT